MNNQENRIKNESELNLYGNKIKCYVLENGSKVINRKGLSDYFLQEVERVKCFNCKSELLKIEEMLAFISIQDMQLYRVLSEQKFICHACEHNLKEKKQEKKIKDHE